MSRLWKIGFDEQTRQFISKNKAREFVEPEPLHQYLGNIQTVFFKDDAKGEVVLIRKANPEL